MKRYIKVTTNCQEVIYEADKMNVEVFVVGLFEELFSKDKYPNVIINMLDMNFIKRHGINLLNKEVKKIEKSYSVFLVVNKTLESVLLDCGFYKREIIKNSKQKAKNELNNKTLVEKITKVVKNVRKKIPKRTLSGEIVYQENINLDEFIFYIVRYVKSNEFNFNVVVINFLECEYINSVQINNLSTKIKELEKTGYKVRIVVKQYIERLLVLGNFYNLEIVLTSLKLVREVFNPKIIKAEKLNVFIELKKSLKKQTIEVLERLREKRNQYLLEEKWEEAIEIIDKMISIKPSVSRYNRRAMVFIKLKKYPAAKKDLDKALALNPEDRKAKKMLKKISGKLDTSLHQLASEVSNISNEKKKSARLSIKRILEKDFAYKDKEEKAHEILDEEDMAFIFKSSRDPSSKEEKDDLEIEDTPLPDSLEEKDDLEIKDAPLPDSLEEKDGKDTVVMPFLDNLEKDSKDTVTPLPDSLEEKDGKDTVVVPFLDSLEEKDGKDTVVVSFLGSLEENGKDIAISLPQSLEEKNGQDTVVISLPKNDNSMCSDYNVEDCYTFNQALQILEVKKKELNSLIQEGILNSFCLKKETMLVKKEVMLYKKEKIMTQPTIIVEEDKFSDVLEEDDDDMFFIDPSLNQSFFKYDDQDMQDLVTDKEQGEFPNLSQIIKEQKKINKELVGNGAIKIGATFGKFKVLSKLGEGGVGEVYLVQHIEQNHLYAFKFIYFDSEDGNSKKIKRFLREFKCGTKIKHKNIVRCYSIEHVPGLFFIVMEYIEGIDLNKYLQKQKKALSLSEFKIIVFQLLKALKFLHENKIIHRDIKPANIMLQRKDGKVHIKLTDFGLAKDFDDDGSLSGKIQSLGTPGFMPPEQKGNTQLANVRADVYSMGATMYYMLTKCYANSVFYNPIEGYNSTVPKVLNKIILKCLEKNPEKRIQTMQELEDLLIQAF